MTAPAPFATDEGRYGIRAVRLEGRQAYGIDPAGLWLASYDPEFAEGRGLCDFTDDPASAARFPSAQAAMACYQARSRRQPTRPDGRPNKPLTAYTVTIEPLPEPPVTPDERG